MIELQIIDGLRPDLVVARSKTFGVQGGVMGRDPACDWVLLDRQKIISGRHARISYSQAGFYLTDISTNGVLDASGRAFNKNELHLLKVGEVFIIGPYRIEVKAIKNSDASLKLNKDLQRLLVDDSQQSLTPFDYVAQSERAQAQIPHFDLKEQSHGTLKAYDFMPESLDLVLNVRSGEAQKSDFDDRTVHRFEVMREEKLPVPVESVPMESQAAASEVYPSNSELRRAPTEFLLRLCEAFGLDQRFFSGLSQDDLENKLLRLVTELLRMSLDVRALLQTFQKSFVNLKEAESDQHNPFFVSVSGRQLFELLLRDDPEFMDLDAALLGMKKDVLGLKKFLEVLPLVEQQLLAQLDPQLFIKPGAHKFNLFQERQAWQMYQQHYQNLAQADARAWLQQLQQLVKEKI